jgi:hypothetical protein
MSIDGTLTDVINLPRNFYSRGNISTHSLLQESGYFAVYEEVTEGAIHDALQRHPNLVSDWMNFSQDKRGGSGWFLCRGGSDNGYQVGHYPDHAPVGYSDELAACAAFIKREIENIRTDGRGP